MGKVMVMVTLMVPVSVLAAVMVTVTYTITVTFTDIGMVMFSVTVTFFDAIAKRTPSDGDIVSNTLPWLAPNLVLTLTLTPHDQPCSGQASGVQLTRYPSRTSTPTPDPYP